MSTENQVPGEQVENQNGAQAQEQGQTNDQQSSKSVGHIHIDVTETGVSVEVNGNGGALVGALAQILNEHEDMRMLFTYALVRSHEVGMDEEDSNDNTEA